MPSSAIRLSLVGSEMCIRDSYNPATWLPNEVRDGLLTLLRILLVSLPQLLDLFMHEFQHTCHHVDASLRCCVSGREAVAARFFLHQSKVTLVSPLYTTRRVRHKGKTSWKTFIQKESPIRREHLRSASSQTVRVALLLCRRVRNGRRRVATPRHRLPRRLAGYMAVSRWRHRGGPEAGSAPKQGQGLGNADEVGGPPTKSRELRDRVQVP